MKKYPETNQKNQKFLSFRWRVLILILAPLLLAIISTQLILWITLNRSNERKKVEFIENSKEKIHDYLVSDRQEFENLVRVNENAQLRRDIDYNNLSSLENFFWYQMNYNPRLAQVYYANEKGQWISIKRKNDGQLVSQYKGTETKGQLWQYTLNKQGQRQGNPIVIKQPFKPQMRPWYIDTKKQRELGWTNTYLFAGLGENKIKNDAGITLYQPIINPQNDTFEGVIGIDLKFDNLNQYLNDIDRTQGDAKLLIMDCSAQMDASRSSKLLAQSNLNETDQLSSNTLEEMAQIYCPDQQGNEKIQGHDVKIFPLNKTLSNLDLLGIIAIPENYFIQDPAWLLKLILLGGVVLSLMAARLAFMVSRNFSEPITTITDAAQAIQSENFQSLDLTKLEKIAQRNNELGILAKVFLKMTKTIYKREESLRNKLEKLQETSIEQYQFSDYEYLDQLIEKSRYLRSSQKNNERE